MNNLNTYLETLKEDSFKVVDLIKGTCYESVLINLGFNLEIKKIDILQFKKKVENKIDSFNSDEINSVYNELIFSNRNTYSNNEYELVQYFRSLWEYKCKKFFFSEKKGDNFNFEVFNNVETNKENLKKSLTKTYQAHKLNWKNFHRDLFEKELKKIGFQLKEEKKGVHNYSLKLDTSKYLVVEFNENEYLSSLSKSFPRLPSNYKMYFESSNSLEEIGGLFHPIFTPSCLNLNQFCHLENHFREGEVRPTPILNYDHKIIKKDNGDIIIKSDPKYDEKIKEHAVFYMKSSFLFAKSYIKTLKKIL